MKSILAIALGLSAPLLLPAGAANEETPPSKPNVIVMLTDDLGYGDIGCYGAMPEHVRTPNIDQLAAEGVRFTDAHSPSSVCTPSRTSLLTGDYAWRHPRGSTILPGDAPLGITPGTLTLPAMFKSQGYATGFVGKWHLGLGEVDENNKARGKIDWNGEIKPGPLELGFDEAFFIPATGDRTPTVFVRNHRVDKLDPADPITVSYKNAVGVTYANNPELATVLRPVPGHGHNQGLTNGVGRIGYMMGGKAALWKDEDIADSLAAETTRFLEKNKDRSFFFYYATHNIHEPRVPHPRFTGKSGCGTYGDHILELDDAVGKLLADLKRLGLDRNTLLVFSSDNGGCSWLGYDYGKGADLHGHRVNGALRGEKGSLFEGGTRVPFIVRWPGGVPAGKVSTALISQTDLFASFAGLLGTNLPESAARDSISLLSALLGKSTDGRTELLEHLYGGPRCALRMGNWKFINGQLYDLSADPGEAHDLAKDQPERAKTMKGHLDELIRSPRTR